MNFALSAEEEAFRRELQAFFEKEVPSHLKLPLMFLAIDTSDKKYRMHGEKWRVSWVKGGGFL